jgi:acetyltransferase-like isoleucine patch superfamily enzyme
MFTMIAVRALLRSLAVRLFRLTCAYRFRSFGRDVYIFPGADISGEECIEIGDRVVILDDVVLAVYPTEHGTQDRVLRIGVGSNIGRRNHIFAFSKIEIGSRVLTANNVYISDCAHGFADRSIPIMDQAVRGLRPVHIGDGAWIGQNACIIGCSIGRNSVVGANSVVLEDIPDHSVAVGSPARVVRRL